MDARAELKEVRAALEGCLEAIDGATTEHERVQRAARAVAQSTRRVEELGARLAGLGPVELASVRDELEELVRLNAVASLAAGRDKLNVAEGMARARENQRSLSFYKEDGAGGSYDTAG